MAAPTRWQTDTGEGHSAWYIERFRTMAAEGADLEGEARLIDAMVGRDSLVLDAGCGPGRCSGALHRMGHRVIGVDADPALIEAAEADHPGPVYVVGDLAELDLSGLDGGAPRFDAALMAGNVLAFVAPGTEAEVLRRIVGHLRPDGFLATGFHIAKVPLGIWEQALADASLVEEHRFATWDLRPWHDDADFLVAVMRRPADGI